MLYLNLDADIRLKMQIEVRPESAAFQSLPLAEQVARLSPFFELQTARDTDRLQVYTEAA